MTTTFETSQMPVISAEAEYTTFRSADTEITVTDIP